MTTLNARFTGLEGRITSLKSLLDARIGDLKSHFDARIGNLESRFDLLLGKVIEIDNRLTRVEERLDHLR